MSISDMLLDGSSRGCAVLFRVAVAIFSRDSPEDDKRSTIERD
jgi:hypothetical protein